MYVLLLRYSTYNLNENGVIKPNIINHKISDFAGIPRVIDHNQIV